MRVCLYVEGGGDQANTLTACKKAFRLFFEKALPGRLKPKIVACGSRDNAHNDFCISLRSDPNTFAVLLVDSEDPVLPGNSAAQHLRRRERHWTANIPEDQVHLMVQCMKTWFLADQPALKQYYGHEFRQSALPGNPSIEDVLKQDVVSGLQNATRGTKKGKYHKTRHGFEILERIDPMAVQQKSRHAAALFGVLITKLDVA